MDIDTYKNFAPSPFANDGLFKMSTHRTAEVAAIEATKAADAAHEAAAVEAALSGTKFVLYGNADPTAATDKGYDTTSCTKIAALFGSGASCTASADKSRALLTVGEAVTAAHVYEVFDADQKSEAPTVTGVTLDHVDLVQSQA